MARASQIFILAGLLLLGVGFRDFSLSPYQILFTFLAGLLTQFLLLHAFQLSYRGYLSVFITCLGLCLLLRSNHLWVHPLVASLAIASKFLIRPCSRHLFNPANLGVVLGLVLFPNTWLTNGQWGTDLILAFWICFSGLFVVHKVTRLEISLSFLFSYSLIFYLIRIVYLGYPLPVLFHHLENGTLLIFTFFMLTDPMTTPDHTLARILQGLLIAVIAYIWQFLLYWNQAVIWSLFIATFLVPVWNIILPSSKFSWSTPGVS